MHRGIARSKAAAVAVETAGETAGEIGAEIGVEIVATEWVAAIGWVATEWAAIALPRAPRETAPAGSDKD